jgi:hypothetical protein
MGDKIGAGTCVGAVSVNSSSSRNPMSSSPKKTDGSRSLESSSSKRSSSRAAANTAARSSSVASSLVGISVASLVSSAVLLPCAWVESGCVPPRSSPKVSSSPAEPQASLTGSAGSSSFDTCFCSCSARAWDISESSNSPKVLSSPAAGHPELSGASLDSSSFSSAGARSSVKFVVKLLFM